MHHPEEQADSIGKDSPDCNFCRAHRHHKVQDYLLPSLLSIVLLFATAALLICNTQQPKKGVAPPAILYEIFLPKANSNSY